jgi:hypothetical protein
VSLLTVATVAPPSQVRSQDIPELATKILAKREGEQVRLRRIRNYVHGNHDSVYVPEGARAEYKRLTKIARTNFLRLVVASVAQNLHVDGYRPSASAGVVDDVSVSLAAARDAMDAGDHEQARQILGSAGDAHRQSQGAPPPDDGPWRIWQANRLGSRQHGLHQKVCEYGIAYTVVLPGDPQPVIRPVSPRRLTALYADQVDDEWPVYAVEECLVEQPGTSRLLVKLYDDTNVYVLTGRAGGGQLQWPDRDELTLLGETSVVQEHGLGVCPVVRYLHEVDLDGESDVSGEVEPLIDLQDQLNNTVFNGLITQQYGAFRQRYVSGMDGADEEGRQKAPFDPGADRLWVAEDPDTKFGEFGQSDLGGFLKSAEATIQHMSTIAQLPPYYLLGELINLSSDALAATRDALDRKVERMQGILSESHKQTLRLAGLAAGDREAWDDLAAVIVWRDTGGKAFSATVDALGKLTQMLGVPATELWQRVPGTTADDVDRWKAAATAQGALAELNKIVEQQMTRQDQPTDNPSPDAPFQPPGLTRTPGV